MHNPTKIPILPSVVSLRFREMLQYRAAAWAGVFTQVVFGFILLMVLLAFYESSDAAPPMGRIELMAYIWIGQALFALMPWSADRGITEMVRTGSVAYELARPVDTYTLWFSRTLGWRLGATLARGAPLLAIAGFLFPVAGLASWALPPPDSAAALLAFFPALAVGVLLAVTINSLLHVSILWTLDPDGIMRIAPAFILLLSGMVIPLPLFPDFLQPLLAALPFRGIIDVPLRLYSGHIPAGEAWKHLSLGAAWTVALIALGRWIMERGLRQVVVQGG